MLQSWLIAAINVDFDLDPGGVAEWSCSGLQSRVRRFDSDPRLQYLHARVVKLVDTRDLKSLAAKAACRFDSGPGHQICSESPISRLFYCFGPLAELRRRWVLVIARASRGLDFWADIITFINPFVRPVLGGRQCIRGPLHRRIWFFILLISNG